MGCFSQNRCYRKGSLRVSLAQSHFPCTMENRSRFRQHLLVYEMPQALRWWPVGTGGQAWRATVPYPGEALLRCGWQLTGCKTSPGRKVWSEDHPWLQQHLQRLIKKCTFSRPAPRPAKSNTSGYSLSSHHLCSQAHRQADNVRATDFREWTRPPIECLGF